MRAAHCLFCGFAACLLAAPWAVMAAVKQATKAAALPDWSGVWACDDSCFQAGGDSSGQDQGRVPLAPKYMQMRIDARTSRAQHNLSFCLPAGTPGVQQHAILHEFLFSPGRVTLLFQDGEVRRIHTDGRPHLSLKDMTASFMGDSIGHWEGDTLVVDTVGFPKGTIFQNFGLTATLQGHLVERYQLRSDGHLYVESTLTDPEIFTKPYVYTRGYAHAKLEMTEPQCSYANHDTGETLDLTPPPEDE